MKCRKSVRQIEKEIRKAYKPFHFTKTPKDITDFNAVRVYSKRMKKI